MKAEDLLIGREYIDTEDGMHIIFRGLDSDGDPVMEALGGVALLMIPYEKCNEEEDPACKEGYFGLSKKEVENLKLVEK